MDRVIAIYNYKCFNLKEKNNNFLFLEIKLNKLLWFWNDPFVFCKQHLHIKCNQNMITCINEKK